MLQLFIKRTLQKQISLINIKMGSEMCTDASRDEGVNIDPLSSEFKQTQDFKIAHEYNTLIDKIKNIRQIVDPRKNHQLKFYRSKYYGFKLLGMITWKRPVGQCLFYFDNDFFDSEDRDLSITKKKKPVIITTKINPHYMFSSNTLIIYDDKSYYIGEIQAKKYQIPKATGKGLLVTSDFIYEGQFEDGYPEGFGRYRTKFLEFTGNIRKGLPYGECIQKTAKGLFMGRIDQKNKVGFLITPQNKRIEVLQKLQNSSIKL